MCSGSMRLHLTEEQVEFLERPVRGQGGYQSLLTRLQSQLRGNCLTLTLTDCEKVVRYSSNYGQGGFQSRLQPIMPIVQRAEAYLNRRPQCT